VREGDWKLLVNEDGSGVQLYDLSKDISEKTNLAARKPEVVERLKKMVLDWRKSLPVEHAPFDRSPGKGQAVRDDPG
jgi:hypothetical protein